jgi:hypothetical protein
MGNFDALLDLDGNGRPIYGDSPFKVSKEITFTTNGTVIKALFTLTGSVMITRLWGEVTTDLGSNHTAASFSLVETAGSTVYLTAVAGTTLSSIKTGSIIIKDKLVAVAVTKIDNVAGAISESATAGVNIFSPVIVTKKTDAVTTVSYRYITNNTSLGAMTVHASYYPLSIDGCLTPA